MVFGNKENRKRFFPQVISRLSKNKNTEIKNPEIGLDYTNVDDAAKMIVKVILKRTQMGFIISAQVIIKIWEKLHNLLQNIE